MPKTSKRYMKNLAKRRKLQAALKKKKAAQNPPRKPIGKLDDVPKPKESGKKLSGGKLGILAGMAAMGGLWNPRDLARSKHRRQKGKQGT